MLFSRLAGKGALWASVLVLGFATSANAFTFFEEGFDASSALWANAGGNAVLDHFATGGEDGGGYASGSFNFLNSAIGDDPVILRAQDEFGSSGGGYIGNWFNGNVYSQTFHVRHNAPLPVNFFARWSGPGNFPGGVAVEFIPVLPGQWTEIQLDINPNSPNFVSFEGTDFKSVFSLVGHLQFGIDVPAALAGVDFDYSFDIDSVLVEAVPVPEPGTGMLVGLGLAGLARAGRPRRN